MSGIFDRKLYQKPVLDRWNKLFSLELIAYTIKNLYDMFEFVFKFLKKKLICLNCSYEVLRDHMGKPMFERRT